MCVVQDPSDIDAVAEDFLNRLEADLENQTTDQEQVTEASRRLVLGERVTETAVMQGKSPAIEAGNAGVELLIGFAISHAVGEIGTRAVGSRWLRTQYEEMSSMLRGLREILVGQGRFPHSLARQFDEFAGEISEETETLIQENEEELANLGESFLSQSISQIGGSFEGTDIGEGLSDIREGSDRFLGSLLYSEFMTRDVPEEQENDNVGVEGINTRIEETSGTLRENYRQQTLSVGDREREAEISAELQRSIQQDTEKVKDGYDTVEDLLGPIQTAEMLFAAAGIILYAGEALASASSLLQSSGKLAKAGVKLSKVTGYLVAAYVFARTFEIGFGWHYLEGIQSAHWQIDLILNYDHSSP